MRKLRPKRICNLLSAQGNLKDETSLATQVFSPYTLFTISPSKPNLFCAENCHPHFFTHAVLWPHHPTHQDISATMNVTLSLAFPLRKVALLAINFSLFKSPVTPSVQSPVTQYVVHTSASPGSYLEKAECPALP